MQPFYSLRPLLGFPRKKPLSFCSPAALHAALWARDEAGEEDAAGGRGRGAHEHTRWYRTSEEKA